MEKIQRKATKMIPELSNLRYEKRLQQLELISLDQIRLQGQLIETFRYANGFNDVTLKGLFDRDDKVWTRNDGQKLAIRNFTTSQALNLFQLKLPAFEICCRKTLFLLPLLCIQKSSRQILKKELPRTKTYRFYIPISWGLCMIAVQACD
ncbi:hypothetical protein FHG87_023961 [Trinorchestia longiramus]|nr:hypothetical protein FHG87_023961 [Trinorchestia longiramus]